MVNAGDLANLDTSNVLSGVGRLGAKLGDLVSILLYLGLLVGIVFLVWRNIQYRHTVVVRELTSNSKRVKTFKARSIKKDGIEYWKLKTRKDLLKSPPSGAREITTKGKVFAECYYTETGGYHWIQDNNSPDALEHVFNVFPTEHKALWMARMRRAEERRKKSGLEVLLQIAPMAIMVIMVVAFLAFYGDIMETNQAAMDKAWSNFNKITEQQTEAVASITSAVGVITGELPRSDLVRPAQNIPLDQSVGGNS